MVNNPGMLESCLTHDDLIYIASKWLTRSCEVIVSEIKGNREIPDAIGWCGSKTILVECKTSRSDYGKDEKKHFRTYGGAGYSRYYLTPQGLIREHELPSKWGWLETDGTFVFVRRRSSPFPDRNVDAETRILVSACRKLGHNNVAGVYAKVHEHYTKRTASIHITTDPVTEALKTYMAAYWRAVDEHKADAMIQSELDRFEQYLTSSGLCGYNEDG